MSSRIINRAFAFVLLNFPVYESDLSQLDIALSYFSPNLFPSDVQVTSLQTTLTRIDCMNITFTSACLIYNFVFPSYICMFLPSEFIL